MPLRIRNDFGNVVKREILEGLRVEWKMENIASEFKEKNTYFCSPVFSFQDEGWFIEIRPFKNSKLAMMLLHSSVREHSVKYIFAAKMQDGTVKSLQSGIMERSKIVSEPLLVKPSEFLEYIGSHHSAIKILCTLKQVRNQSTQRVEWSKYEELIELSRDFKNLFGNKENCDTILHVMDKEYRAHKAILIARSPVFAAMFRQKMSEVETGKVIIPDCDPESFGEFLEFLYSGSVKNLSFRSALHLYKTSEKYDVQLLKRICTGYLVNNLTAENFCDVMNIADIYDDTTLLSAAQCFFKRNFTEVCTTSQWKCLHKNNLHLAYKMLCQVNQYLKDESYAIKNKYINID